MRPCICSYLVCCCQSRFGCWFVVAAKSAMVLIVDWFVLAQGVILDLGSLVFPMGCVVPAGEGPLALNEAVLYRDEQRAVGLPFGYARPSVSLVSVVNNIPADAEVGPSCDDSWTFTFPSLLTSTTPVMVVPTVGTRVQLQGTNFGLNPVVLAGLAATPAVVCTANHTFIDVIVGAGEGTGLVYKTSGYVIELTVATQSAISPMIRMSYAPPTVSGVAGDGPTPGGSVVTVTGTNFGVTKPSIWIGRGDFASALPCGNVSRLSHTTATCVLPPGSGVGYAAFVSVADLPSRGPATGGSFKYNVPEIDVITTLDMVTVRRDGSRAGAVEFANETFVWRRSTVLEVMASNGSVNATGNFIQGKDCRVFRR